jgi:hypothetical protein
MPTASRCRTQTSRRFLAGRTSAAQQLPADCVASHCRVSMVFFARSDLQAGDRFAPSRPVGNSSMTGRDSGRISTASIAGGKGAHAARSETRNIYTFIPGGSWRRLGDSVHGRQCADARTNHGHECDHERTDHRNSGAAIGAIIGSTPASHGRAVARSAARRRLTAALIRRHRLPAPIRIVAP